MKDIPLNAKVECADGPCGKSVTVIVDPATETVTHFVVESKDIRPPHQRLVPVDQVAETSRDLIRLRCTRDELGWMEPFTEKHVPKVETPDWSMYQGGEGQIPPVTPMDTTYDLVEVERIPAGELAVRPGTRVEATDGHVGHVGEFLAEPGSEHITHFLLQEGHLWAKKEVTVPVSAIDHLQGDTLYLNLDKRAIEELPTVPFRRR